MFYRGFSFDTYLEAKCNAVSPLSLAKFIFAPSEETSFATMSGLPYLNCHKCYPTEHFSILVPTPLW